MTITSLLPVIALVLFLIATLYFALGGQLFKQGMWVFPAVLSGMYLVFSLYTVWVEGFSAVWVEHTRNLWGNQIWLDLLMAVGIGWFFIVPQAKSVGMRLLPWWLLVVCTGNIGFMAMLARLLYLQENATKLTPSQ